MLILITCSKKRDIVQLPSLLPGQTIRPSGIRDKGKKSGSVPEIPGQLEPMQFAYHSGLESHTCRKWPKLCPDTCLKRRSSGLAGEKRQIILWWFSTLSMDGVTLIEKGHVKLTVSTLL